jgi:hypothetical protein
VCEGEVLEKGRREKREGSKGVGEKGGKGVKE